VNIPKVDFISWFSNISFFGIKKIILIKMAKKEIAKLSVLNVISTSRSWLLGGSCGLFLVYLQITKRYFSDITLGTANLNYTADFNYPYRVVQIGAPRTGSTFQFELLKAIVHLKSPTGSDVLTTHVALTDDINDVLTDIFQKTKSFVLKLHVEAEILKELQSQGDILVFASSDIVPYASYVQDRKNLVACSMCEIENYQPLFGLTTNEVQILKEYMSLFEKIRQCCGMQMSKYEIMRLNGCDMKKHVEKPDYPMCEQYDFTDIERKFEANPIPYHEKNPELLWAKPGDCARFNSEISSGKGFNGSIFDGCYIDGRFAGKKKQKRVKKGKNQS